LLILDRRTGELTDTRFNRIGDFLRPGDCLVLNDTKVLAARFFARRATGARLEGLFLTETEPGTWEVMLKGLAKVKLDEQICLTDRNKGDFCKAEVTEKRAGGICLLRVFAASPPETILDRIGFPPLPPYIRRGDDPVVAAEDKLRYQTVYAREAGAVAAPTAGLHFTSDLIEQLEQAGICFARVTLHVGTGTFKPITTERIEDYRIHEERFSIDAENVRVVNAAKDDGRRTVAVGTTSTRVLETIGDHLPVGGVAGTTGLFITPGYEFEIVDAMITNFHLPRTTLLALVAAFAGLEEILAAYEHAVEQRYRFYSYGDAMLIV
jgi:S-adenosylmethionine:tRNA ribosyltransferase-isomerase